MMTQLLLGLRFVLELTALVYLAAGGLMLDGPTGIATACIAVTVGIAIWGRWMAPKSLRRLSDPARFGAEVVFFTACAVAGSQQWGFWPAAAFGSLAVVVAAAVRVVSSPSSP